jgi:predicted PhzF superfamily epimerase YddE/YHI9
MKLPIYQVDAFTSRLFGGNPAAVVLLDEWLPDLVMQNIGRENNLSETAFVIPREDLSELRWFTPTMEVDLCGHATLAAGYVLFNHLYPSLNEIRFSTRSGILGVQRFGEMLSLDFPSLVVSPAAISGVEAALGAHPRETMLSNSLLAVFGSEDEIRAIRPDYEAIAALGAWMVIVTAEGKDVDYVFRVFAPGAGIPEDPATGSAHCTLIPYWAGRLGKSTFNARQISTRVGEFSCELRGSRVRISGKAVEYLHGEIHVG